MSPTKKKGSNMDDLISIADAARLRGVTHGAIRNLIDRGRLPSQEVAGRRVLRRSDVMRFIPEKGGRGRKASK
ncbi:MAG TPA: helix-turn-helix domain-containing protein [Pyrinomonadaceae bacterium]|nr:helix-turn-helix domain-containing protein [Pyrinomonadaceae bacterium]